MAGEGTGRKKKGGKSGFARIAITVEEREEETGSVRLWQKNANRN